MGPKTFVECYVCLKEFGTRSISFHEPKCLEKWRTSNQKLPAEKRTSTPVKPAGWKLSKISFWICSHCDESVPFAKKHQHILSCSGGNFSSNKLSPDSGKMTGVVKSEFSPKRGKENRNISNHIPTLSVGKKNAKNIAKSESPNAAQTACDTKDLTSSSISPDSESNEESISTSKRSVRPQTKILRRPTPNLKHPVIQVDSDDSSGDSSCSDKGKEDNPKRLKMGSEMADGTHKPKNFIMYNKYNVDKNTKNSSKERTSATMPTAIPNPCNSCNRSQAPERLHSHARKDSRGLMNRKSPSFDVKMVSPQKKSPDSLEKIKVKHKELKAITNGNGAITNGGSAVTNGIGVVSNGSSAITHGNGAIPNGIGAMTNSNGAVPNCKSVKHKPVPEIKERSPKKKSEELPIEVSVVEPTPVEEPAVDELVEPMKACYICQEQFKVSSLRLHESQCLESWKKINNSLTPNLRKLPPRRPEEDDLPTPEEADPEWRTVQSQLIPCPLCGRTFFPERLPVHRRVCKGKSSPRPLKRASSMREHSATSKNEEEQKPAAVYVPCYVCGRNFGSWVIQMHEQQCLRKWRRENDKLPNDQQMEEPQKSYELSPDDDVASLVELGDNAWESHLQQLVPCPLCSRTFFPNRLAVHKRSCKGLSGNQRPRSNRAV